MCSADQCRWVSEGAERGKWRRSRLSSRLHSPRSFARSSKQPTQPTVPCGGEPFRQRRCIALERDFGQPSAPPQRSGSARQSRSDAAAPLRAASRSSPPAEPGEQGTSLRQRPAKCGCRPRPKSASRQQSSETRLQPHAALQPRFPVRDLSIRKQAHSISSCTCCTLYAGIQHDKEDPHTP